MEAHGFSHPVALPACFLVLLEDIHYDPKAPMQRAMVTEVSLDNRAGDEYPAVGILAPNEGRDTSSFRDFLNGLAPVLAEDAMDIPREARLPIPM